MISTRGIYIFPVKGAILIGWDFAYDKLQDSFTV